MAGEGFEPWFVERFAGDMNAYVLGNKGVGKGRRGFVWGGEESEARWRARMDRAMRRAEELQPRVTRRCNEFIRARVDVFRARRERGGDRVLDLRASHADQWYNLEGRLRRHFGLLGRAQEEATDVMEGDDGVVAHMAGVWRRGAWRVPPMLQNAERAVEVAEGWLATAGDQDVEFYDRLLALCQWWEDVVTIEDGW